MPVSAKKASKIAFIFGPYKGERGAAWGQMVKRNCADLRERIEHELDGKIIYAFSERAHLLEFESPPFGDDVHRNFPSAQYDIEEAGKSLAFRRSTACVMHLMRVAEVGLGALSSRFGISFEHKNWHNLLDQIESAVSDMSSASHGAGWKADQKFYSEAAAHFRIIKDAWRNHAMHVREKYTEEQAEDVYRSTRAMMRQLALRLSEPSVSAPLS